MMKLNGHLVLGNDDRGVRLEYGNENIDYPIPSQKDLVGNSKVPYNTMALLIMNSFMDKRGNKRHNYIYEDMIIDVIDELKEQKKLGLYNGRIPSVRTIKNHIKTLNKLGFEHITIRDNNDGRGLYYHIDIMANEGLYVKIPMLMIKELLASTNTNMLRLYVILKVALKDNTKYHKPIERKYICRLLGLSELSHKNLQQISTMTTSLANLGFIDIKVKTTTHIINGKEVPKTLNYFRLTTIDEYKNAKNRGKERVGNFIA